VRRISRQTLSHTMRPSLPVQKASSGGLQCAFLKRCVRRGSSQMSSRIVSQSAPAIRASIGGGLWICLQRCGGKAFSQTSSPMARSFAFVRGLISGKLH
ncbi:unnamed protein product, partial [Polarella glacialis]